MFKIHDRVRLHDATKPMAGSVVRILGTRVRVLWDDGTTRLLQSSLLLPTDAPTPTLTLNLRRF